MKVLITGYYGFDNIGDEVMLQVVISEIKERFLDAEIKLWSSDPKGTIAKTGCKAELHPFAGGKTWWRDLVQTDVLIFGGGTFLQDYGPDSPYPWWNLFWYLKVVGLSRMLGKKVIMLGIGVGPIKTFWGKLLSLSTIMLANYAGIRDNTSFQNLKLIRCINRNIHLTEDLVFLFNPKREELFMQAKKIRIGICLREFCEIKEKFIMTMFHATATAIQNAIQNQEYEYEIHLIPFQGNREDDLALSRRFAQFFPQNYVVLHDVDIDAQAMYNLIRHMDLVIAMRLHALIFSVLAQKPIIALSYHPKVASFAAKWGIPCHEISKISNRIFVQNVSDFLGRRVKYDISKAIESAKNNFKGLDLLCGVKFGLRL